MCTERRGVRGVEEDDISREQISFKHAMSHTF